MTARPSFLDDEGSHGVGGDFPIRSSSHWGKLARCLPFCLHLSSYNLARLFMETISTIEPLAGTGNLSVHDRGIRGPRLLLLHGSSRPIHLNRKPCHRARISIRSKIQCMKSMKDRRHWMLSMLLSCLTRRRARTSWGKQSQCLPLVHDLWS
jgi:hypothetical protein